MTRDPEASIERLRDRLEQRDGMSDADAELLLKASDRIRLLGRSEYSAQRHRFHLMRWTNMATEHGGLADALEDRDAAEALVRWIHDEYDNPETNKDYRVALRMLGELATDEEGKPDSIEWIPGGYPSTYDPAPDPTEMLRWDEDVKPMLDASRNTRDAALIALAWDLGPRPGELLELTIGSITDHEYGLQVTVDGKQGRRSPIVVKATPYVNRWLADHPASGEADAPLWSKLSSPERISRRMLAKIFEQAADRADVTRPVTPTNFRKSSASYLASQGVSQAHLEEHHGWARGSDVAARYIAVFGDATDREVARAHGLDVETDRERPTTPEECPRCGERVPADAAVCAFCGQALDPSAAEDLAEVRDLIRDRAATADHPAKRREAADTLSAMDRDPSIADEIIAAYRDHDGGASPNSRS